MGAAATTSIPCQAKDRNPSQRPRRAAAPGRHLIRLFDGTRAFLHAAIDNYSRRILSWSLEDHLGSGGTCRLLRDAACQLRSGSQRTTVVTDAGCENVNSDVDGLLEDEGLRRTLAQVDVTFSNSMIEAFWRSLKHSWLYLHSLESVESLRRLVDFYVRQHNEVMPHAAFEGQTPAMPNPPSAKESLRSRMRNGRPETGPIGGLGRVRQG